MKKILISTLFLIFISGAFQLTFGQAKGFGLGVVLGEPTGISFKSWTSPHGAFDGGVAWSVSNYYNKSGYLHLHADYLVHNFKLVDVNQGQLPFYLGLGAKVVFANDPVFGARIPLGMNYIFGDVPLDLFAEIVPGLNFIPSTDFSLEGGIGIRYWFR